MRAGVLGLAVVCGCALGCGAKSATDAGPEGLDAGATLTGTHAFAVKSVGAFFRTIADGGADLSRPTVFVTSADIGCQSPFGALNQPALAIMVQRFSSDGGSAEGSYVGGTQGIDVQFVSAPGDGGFPTSFLPRPMGNFTYVTVSDLGVTGTLDVAWDDGGTVAGSFSAPYCGLIPP